MFNSGILDVAIGIVFIYLLVSLIVSAVNELCAALLKARGRILRQGISNLLPADKKTDYARLVYEHPLIGGLSKINRPSYIPARTFALALLDVVSGGSGHIAQGKQLQARLDQLPDELRRPLHLLLDEARHDREHFRAALEVWFNDSMDRVSGVYKRRVQYALFGFGLFFAVSLNVDTIVLANRLSHDSALRSALVSNAEAAAKIPPPAVTSGTPTTQEQSAALAGTIAQLDQLRLPIGWSGPGADLTPAFARLGLFGGLIDALRRHLLGWVLTAFAATLGAPFWFDLLNRFTNVRSAGKAPEEKPKIRKLFRSLRRPVTRRATPPPSRKLEKPHETKPIEKRRPQDRREKASRRADQIEAETTADTPRPSGRGGGCEIPRPKRKQPEIRRAIPVGIVVPAGPAEGPPAAMLAGDPMRLLTLGRKGDDVAQWQQFLADHGFNPGQVDGFFGGGTRLGTIAFQKQHHIFADGIVGGATRAAAGQLGFTVPTAGLAVHSSAHDEDDVVGHFRPDITVFETRGGGAVYCKTGMAIDADGSYHAYKVRNLRLDFDDNGKDPCAAHGRWIGVVTDGAGRPIPQQAHHPAPGFLISTTSLEEPTRCAMSIRNRSPTSCCRAGISAGRR